MQLKLDPKVIANLGKEIEDTIKGDAKLSGREKAARRIQLAMEGIARTLNMTGEVKMFGSFSNGFKTGSSDLDVVYNGTVRPDKNIISLLGKFATQVPEFGFQNVTKIFQATVPLVKFTDIKSGMEVDFCINNELGVRNSLLLHAYCEYDNRVLVLGRLVKDWAKKHELVGTADGCLNSYAYMLLVIHFLQSVKPPVVPNLQQLAKEPVRVADSKWGCEDVWETKFEDDVRSLPKSENDMSTCELLIRFFQFFTCIFDWHAHAVCMRLNRPGSAVDKYSLATPTSDEQWYVEDPFDLKHNLAGKCTRAGRKRILEEMRNSLTILTTGGPWAQAFPPGRMTIFYLKCRISQGVTPPALLEEFEDFDLVKLHFPKADSGGRMAQAFLEFSSAAARRRAHTKNETYVADCQLQLHYSTQHSLAEAISQSPFSTYEMASYKMQRQIVQTRVKYGGPSMMLPRSDVGRANAGFLENGSMMVPPPPPPQPNPSADDMYRGGPQPYYGFPPRPPPHPQIMPSQAPGPPGAWGSQMAMGGLPKQHAADFPLQQQRKAQADMPRAKSVAVGKMRASSVQPHGTNSSNKKPLAQVSTSDRIFPLAAPLVAARNGVLSHAAPADPAAPAGVGDEGHTSWLQVQVGVDLPQKDVSILSPADCESIEKLLPLLRKFPLEGHGLKPGEGLTIRVDVEDDLPQQRPLLPGDLWAKLQNIQGWLEKSKAG